MSLIACITRYEWYQ